MACFDDLRGEGGWLVGGGEEGGGREGGGWGTDIEVLGVDFLVFGEVEVFLGDEDAL